MNPIVYSNKENQFYSFLLATNNSNLGSDYINGGDVVKLFMKANLDKNILKIIWDLSSKRKAKDLNKDEFFYACRLITLAQNNQLLTEQNVIKLNNSNLIPSFNGVSFIYQEPKIQNNNFEKIENDDFKDDDFVAIDEDPNKQIKEGESIDQAKINIINAFMKSNTTIKKKEEVKEDNDKDFQFVQEEFKPTKKLDDLFGLLGNYDQDKKDEEQKVNNELNQKINNNMINNNNNMNNMNNNINNTNMNVNMNMNSNNMMNNIKNMNNNNMINNNNYMNNNINNTNVNMNNNNMINNNKNMNNNMNSNTININNNFNMNMNLNTLNKGNSFSNITTNINIQGISDHFNDLNEIPTSSNDNNIKNNNEVPSDDEFVAIEEETTEKKVDNKNNNLNNFDFTEPIKSEIKTNDKNDKMNNFDFLNSKNSISPNVNSKIENNFPINNINIKSQKTHEIVQPKNLSLDDFMGAFNIEIKNDNNNNNNNNNINSNNEINNKKEFDMNLDFNINKEKENKIEEKKLDNFDDNDDFEEVEEEEKNTNEKKENNERIIPKTINIENKGIEINEKNKNEINDNEKNVNNLENNENIDKENKNENENEDFEFTNVEEEEEKKEEEKKENKPSILGFTQMDFLNEFKKEVNPNALEEENQFDFVEEKEEEEKPKKEKKKNLNPIEDFLEKNFENEELKLMFYSNLEIIFEKLNHELEKNIPFLNSLWSFGNVELTKEKISSNKRLNDFLNGNLNLLILYAKFISTKNYINHKKCKVNQKLFQKIYELLLKLSKSGNFGNLFEKNNFDKIKNQQIEINDNINNYCKLCLHDINNEGNKNVFGFDFHISCINLWVNLVDINSPFKNSNK